MDRTTSARDSRKPALDRSRIAEAARLLDDLDDEQRAAVIHPAHALCITAGAGSGKTRVLTRRLAYRATIGEIHLDRAVAITFTRQAASQLRTRLWRSGIAGADLVTASTLHAMALRTLQQWSADRRRPSPKIVEHKIRLLDRAAASIGLDVDRAWLRSAERSIEWAAARRIGAETIADAEHITDAEQVAALYERYTLEKRRRGVLDLDDLILRAADVLVDDREFAAGHQFMHRAWFIDEAQDLTPAQLQLIRAWTQTGAGGSFPIELTAVGDARQAIYGFAGSSTDALEQLFAHRPDATSIALERNHRSHPRIQAVGRAVLGHASDESIAPDDAMQSDSTTMPRVTLHVVADEQAEAETIAARVAAHRELHGVSSSCAVLVRTNAQIPMIRETLELAGIAVASRFTHQLLDQPIVRRAMSELRSRVDGAPGRRLRAHVEELREWAAPTTTAAIDPTERQARNALLAIAQEFADQRPDATIDDLVAHLRLARIDERRNAESHSTLTGTDTVTVTTFHRAKGLEWSVVFLAGIEEGLVPHAAATDAAALAEEQRLLHVAVTRARHEVHAFAAERRAQRTNQRAGTRVVSRWWPDELSAQSTGTPDASQPRDVPEALSAARRSLRARQNDRPAVDRELGHRLRHWRSTRARAARAVPQAILSDQALDAIARQRPRSLEDLAAVTGIGAIQLAHIGPELLHTVHP